MTKYLLTRLLRGAISIVIVVAIVMLLVYSFLERDMIFSADPNFTKQKNNNKVAYQMQMWERYGYLDYVPYADWLGQKLSSGEIDQETFDKAVKFSDKQFNSKGERLDNELAMKYVDEFSEYYEGKGYEIERRDAIMKGKTKKYQDGGAPRLFAYKDVPVIERLGKYFLKLIVVDNIHYVQEEIGERGITFTWYDPAYGGEKFSPAIMGNGTYYKYLLYCSDSFPFIHQNLIRLNLGQSYSINQGVDVFNTLTAAQGSFAISTVSYPSGVVADSADNLHSARYVAGSLAAGTPVIQTNFVDDYTLIDINKAGFSKMGYSFVIGILASLMAYLLAVPIGTVMARRKDKLLDKLGTVYIIFIIAVPSLAYIFLFKAIGGAVFDLPTTFDMEKPSWQMYVLPIVSLALPSVANLMKWLRRYMIDQMNSDYVRFARSGGLSEQEIFSKHILKNAIIPIVHGIPGTILFAMTGAIITERVYVVPGAGHMLTKAINAYDNGVIVGMTLFYAVLSVVAIILGDVLMSMVDPRISFTSKQR